MLKGKYKKEELGWNTAVGNSLVLIFIGILEIGIFLIS